MKMNEMNEAFAKEGFIVKRDYVTDKKSHHFTIRKDGISVEGDYTWYQHLSNLENGIRQSRFINQLIRTWEDAYDRKQAINYITNDVDLTRSVIGYMNNADKAVYLQGAWKCLPAIEDVIFNGPATIVKWSDGTKTVVKCCEDDLFDPEKGLAMAISKKALGDLKEVKKWTKKYEKPDISFVFEHTATTTAEAVENLKRAAKHMINEVFGR